MNRFLNDILIVCAAVAFFYSTGCAGEDPYVRLKQTERDYRECLERHQGDEKVCTAAKSIYETEQERYRSR